MATPMGAGPPVIGSGKCCLGGGRYPQRTSERWQPSSGASGPAWGRGVLPRQWSLLSGRLRGMATPSGAGPLAGGTGVLPKRWSLPTERLRGMGWDEVYAVLPFFVCMHTVIVSLVTSPPSFLPTILHKVSTTMGSSNVRQYPFCAHVDAFSLVYPTPCGIVEPLAIRQRSVDDKIHYYTPPPLKLS